MNKVLFSSLSVDWPTPKYLYKQLNKEFKFNDDPCPLYGSGGLDRSWGSRVFINPPYNKAIRFWIEKGLKERPEIMVFLLPSRTDVKWFHELVLPYAKEIRFIKGRLRFGESKNSAPFPSMIVIF